MIKRYHHQLGLPQIQMNNGVINLVYSFHALSRAQDKAMTLPKTLDTRTAKIIEIEVETENHTVVKILYRTAYNAQFDILVALIPGRNFVKTAWLNSVDESKYYRIK